MELIVKRTQLTNDYTTGHLYINGEYFCDTLEDKVRKLTSIDGKVYGRTAIPSGTYPVIMDYSSHFKRPLPHILDVPYFSGIRIHSGNEVDDTNGCILVGSYYRAGYITNSKDTMSKLSERLTECINNGGRITLTIS